MSSSRSTNNGYKVTQGLKENFEDSEVAGMKETRKFCKNFPTLVSGLIATIDVNRAAASIACNMVIDAALGFGKGFESLDINRIVNGNAALFQPGCGLSDRAVRHMMKELGKAKIILSISRHGCPTLYGINLTLLLDHLRNEFTILEKTHSRNERQEDAVAAWNHLKFKLKALDSAAAKILAISGLVIRDDDTFLEQAKHLMRAAAVLNGTATAVPSSPDTKSGTANDGVAEPVPESDVKVEADMRSKPIKGKHAGDDVPAKTKEALSVEPCPIALYDENGKPLSNQALEFWHSTVRADPEHYGSYHVKGTDGIGTGKMKGSMANYLRELKATGMHEDEVRQHIVTLIKNWHVPSYDARKVTMTGTRKDTGAPFSRRNEMPIQPDFEFFFNHRVDCTRQVFAKVRASLGCSVAGPWTDKSIGFGTRFDFN